MAFIPILELSPTWEETKMSARTSSESTALGDGYIQVVNDPSPAPPDEDWDVCAYVNDDRRIELLAFFRQLGGDAQFRWLPSPAIGTKVCVCKSWDFKPTAPGLYKLTARFEAKSSFQCPEFIDAIDGDLIQEIITSAVSWMNTYARSQTPFIVNGQGVSVNSFHDVLGRGGYLPPSTGTSEGQFSIIRALLLARKASNNAQTKSTAGDLALRLAGPLESVFYLGQSVPTNPATDYWLPHWLINARGDFVSKGSQSASDFLNFGHFGVSVNFVNGVGVVPGTLGSELADVYKAHSVGAKLLWQNVYAPLVSGTEYPIEYWVTNLQMLGQRYRFNPSYQQPGATGPVPTSENAGKVVLVNKTFTGTLQLSLSAYDGATINQNEAMEANPMWRPLFSGGGGSIS